MVFSRYADNCSGFIRWGENSPEGEKSHVLVVYAVKNIRNFFAGYYYLLTALLIFLSFPSYDVWLLKGFPFFAWISLVPLFHYIRGKNSREVFTASFITGLLGSFLAYQWIGAFGAKVPGGYIVVILFLIPSLAVFFASRVIVAEYLSRRFERLRMLIYPSVWIFVDWIQSIGFLAFPWTYWGYSQYPVTPLIQMSSYTGVMGVTFLLILMNYALSDLLAFLEKNREGFSSVVRRAPFIRVFVLFSFVLALIVYGSAIMPNSDSPKRDMRVSIVQTCISPWINWYGNRFIYLKSLTAYTEDSMRYDPDLIVWSEYATLEKISYDYERGDLDTFERLVLNVAREHGKFLLTGEIGILEDYLNELLYPQNSAVLINKAGEVVQTYPKIHLVPFGEWFPYGRWLPCIQRILHEFGGSNFVPGSEPLLFEMMGRRFGCLVCYEGIFYRLCREYRSRGADFFVNITNDGWTDTYSGHMQHFSASIFRAVENGIWYVRCGNTGYSALIDPYGRIVKSMPILEKGYIVGDIDFSMNHSTFYAQYGDIFLYLTMVFLLVITVIHGYTIVRIHFYSRT